MTDNADRRKYIRFPFDYIVELRLINENKWFSAKCDNISLNGLMFLSDKLLLAKDKIEISIVCPKQNKSILNLNAIVVWVMKMDEYSKEQFLTGIQYVDLDEEKYEHLKKFIHDFIPENIQKKSVVKKKKNYKILFLDDNVSLTKLFLCLGKEYDFQAITANRFQEAIDLAVSELPDVIITDINIPDGDGYSFTAKLKIHEKTKNIPIIGCSVTFPRGGKKFFLLGGNKFVNDKPSSIEKLNLILEGILPQITAVSS